MQRFEGKRVLFFQQRGWAINIGHYLARRFQEEGAVLGAVTLKKTTNEFIRSQREVRYEFLVSHDQVMEEPERYLNGDRYSLNEICAEYQVDSLWPLVQSLRNYVKSYRDKWYYGFKQSVDDEGIVMYVQAAHKMCRAIFDDFKPDLIITPNFVAYPHIIVNLYARRMGIRMLGVTDSKVRGVNIIVESFLEDTGEFFEHLDLLDNGSAVSPKVQMAINYITENRRKLDQKFSGMTPRKVNAIREILRLVRQLAGSVVRQNYIRGLGRTLDSPGPTLVWRDFWAQRAYTRASERFRYHTFDAKRRYAFMGLQFQPEASIDVISPRFNNQIETARQIAMSLPGDMTLVVKDHPAMLGYRNPSYLEKVARTPNVKLVDYRTPTQQILEHAAIVIGATGTVFFEAALQRVPVIQLGDLGTTLRLPNVVRHVNLSTLSAKIKEVLDVPFEESEYERRMVNYVSAALDVGFNHNYFGIWNSGEEGNLEAIYQLHAATALRDTRATFGNVA